MKLKENFRETIYNMAKNDILILADTIEMMKHNKKLLTDTSINELDLVNDACNDVLMDRFTSTID